MMLQRQIKSLLVFLIALFSLSSCDWQYQALTNSIPIEGKPTGADQPVYVYIALDGVSHSTLQKAVAQGAFSAKTWKPASKFISPFPANSDLGWSRIMHTEKIPSYDYQYYNSKTDKMYNTGYVGVLKHADPFHSLPAHKVFNYFGNGYSDKYLIYRQRPMSYARRLDEIFIRLDGVSETSNIFAGYIPETDTRSHMDSEEDIIQMMLTLSEKIETFKANHPEKEFVFTLFSDHGNDFVHVSVDKMVEYDKEMEKLGITPTLSLTQTDPSEALYAIPIVHTRVTYVAVYAHKQNEEIIAEKLSTLESVETVISHASKPEGYDGTQEYEWYAVWRNGVKALSYGFDPVNDMYLLTFTDDYQAFDLEIPFSSTELFQTLSDDQIFEATKNSNYPDLFFRTRTALNEVGIEFPASMILSCKTGYASIGFKIPGGANEIASSSFHGALDAAGSTGLILTEEKEIPTVTRADTFIDLFPNMKTFVTDVRGLEMIPGDANSSLNYVELATQ